MPNLTVVSAPSPRDRWSMVVDVLADELTAPGSSGLTVADALEMAREGYELAIGGFDRLAIVPSLASFYIAS